MEVTITHKGRYTSGVIYLLCAAFLAAAYFSKEQKGDAVAGVLILCGIGVAVAAWMFLTGNEQEILDARGITCVTLFGQTTYGWEQVLCYGIRMMPVVRGTRIHLTQKEPRIFVHTDNKRINLEYREDVLSCLERYSGEPTYDYR